MDVTSLEQTSSANLEERPIVGTNLPSIDSVKISVDKLDDTNFYKKKSEMERELEDAKILGQDKKRALHDEALHKEVEIDFEMMELELQRVLLDVEALVKEDDNIWSQLHEMKIGQSGICFQPLPIVHLEKRVDDGGRNVLVIKPCGYCNQCYHYYDITITSCKHCFHSFCLGAML